MPAFGPQENMPHPPRGRRGASIFAGFLLITATPAIGQDAVRIWGYANYDTEAYALPVDDLAAGQSGSGVYSYALLGNDGRIRVFSSYSMPGDAPPAPAGTSYTRVQISREFGIALCANGQLVTWGPSGGLPAPALPPGTTFADVSAGGGHAVALRSDGVAVAWGANYSGQISLPALPPGVTVQKARAGTGTTHLLLSNGTIVTVGASIYGLTSVPALPPGLAYVDLWIGHYHGLAKRSDGTFVGWGEATAGQLAIPALPPSLTYTSMSAGFEHTLAIRSDGAVVAFGSNRHGECGVPALPPGAVPVQVVAGARLSLVRFQDGSVVSWGADRLTGPTAALLPGERWQTTTGSFYAHGLTTAGRIVPIGTRQSASPALPPGLVYTDLDAGTGHAVALRSDGFAVAWGDNSKGQLAIPPLPTGMHYTEVDATSRSTMLLRSDGHLVEAGYSFPTLYVPPTPPPGLAFVGLHCNGGGATLLLSNGAVEVYDYTWAFYEAAPALPTGVHYIQVASYAALRSDGEIEVWDGNVHSPFPPLPPGVVYVEVDGAGQDLVARRSDGQVVVAGRSFNGTELIPWPMPEPGESFYDVSGGDSSAAVRVGPTCTYVSFAGGCAGSLSPSRLVPRDTPRIGETFELTVFDLPQDTAMLVFGWSSTAPVPLGNFGLPGCSQHVTANAAIALAGQGGNAGWSLTIPNEASLIGVHFFNQAVVFDPAANPAGAVVSDAAEAVIGHR